MLNELLSKLGASAKTTVGVSVTPGIGLEMITIDRSSKTVSKYANAPLEYNYSTREIVNYEEFKAGLALMFETLHIPKNSNVILNLPNVHFGIISLPLLLTDDAITNAIISEAEQSYIFKRQDPVVSWIELSSNIESENRVLGYSAIQQNVLDSIQDVCAELGCKLLGIENSYTSLLKTLHYTGLASEQMRDGITWNLMIIGQNSYSIISMVGQRIIEYYEEPLALKSFVGDEIYNAITSSSQITLTSLPANYLYIVSETDLVSAEVLSMKTSFEGEVKFLECNKFIQNEILPANLGILPNVALKISPEAIGVGIYQITDYLIKFNHCGSTNLMSTSDIDSDGIPKIRFGNVEIELAPELIKKLAIFLISLILIFGIAFSFTVTSLLGKQQAKADELNAKISQYNAEIQKYTNAGMENVFNSAAEIASIQSSNRTKLLYYSALELTTPKKLWLTEFKTINSSSVDIKGRATDVESVYIFFKSIKQSIIKSDVRLYKLEMVSKSLDDVVSASYIPTFYDFEITNMTEAELNPKTGAAQEEQKPPEQPAQQEEKKSIFTPSKPLFGGDSEKTNGGLPSNLKEVEGF